MRARTLIEIAGEPVAFEWGESFHLGSAAYWIDQTQQRPPTTSYRLGATLAEEVAACLLGGHGVRAPVALAAFDLLRRGDLLTLDAPPIAAELERRLREPLHIAGSKRPVRYRFARQRAERIASALQILAVSNPPSEPLRLREWLLQFPGVGAKTASWIVRNFCGSDDVAIIDIHVHRAGLSAGFFAPHWRLPRDYGKFEAAFLTVAELGAVPASALDACVWDQLQFLGRAANLLLGRPALV